MNSKYCVPIRDLPSLNESTHEEILNWYKHNKETLKSWYQEKGFTVSGYKTNAYFASKKITQQPIDLDNFNFGKKLLESNGIHIDYTDIVFGIQRCYKIVPPHTDPKRTASLIYTIMGEAETNFYEMENFVPDIDYTNHKLELKETVKMELKKWYLFNNAAIHEVGKITNDLRLSFVITLTNRFIDFEDAKNNLQKIFLY